MPFFLCVITWCIFTCVINNYICFMRYFMRFYALFYKPKAPNKAFRTPSTIPVDKLSSYYVLILNVSTVNLGRVNMDFGLFLAFGYKI